MLYGSGIDLTFVPEFLEVLRDEKSSFYQKFFTRAEMRHSRARGEERAAQHLAACYAVKEALLKALDGPRLHQPPALAFEYQEIETLNDEFGRPFLRFHGELKNYLMEMGIKKSYVSITHTGDYAMAQVILET